jgi:hypothetical protein
LKYPRYLALAADHQALFHLACDAFARGQFYEALAETRKMFVVDPASGFGSHDIIWCDHIPGLSHIYAGLVQLAADKEVLHCMVQLEQLRARTWSPLGYCHAVNLIMCARKSGYLHAHDLLFDTGDGAFSGTPSKLSFCSANPSDALVMDPEFAFSDGYLQCRLANAQQPSWRHRYDKIIWRGSTTGQWLEPSSSDRIQGRWNWLQRLRLCQAAADSQHADYMDIGISSIVQLDQEREAAVRESGLMRAPINAGDFGHFRYAVDIDGNTNAWSGLFTKLLMGCCVLKVESPFGFRQWYYPRMRPWEHYAPVKADLSDLDEVVERLRAKPAIGEMIAERGQALARDMTIEKSLDEAMDTISGFSKGGANSG